MRYTLGKKATRSSSTASMALAVFLILCGLLIIVGSPGLSCGQSRAERTAAQRVLEALRAARKADQALSSGNYGTAHGYVRKTQDSLTEALSELQGGPEAGLK